MATSTFVLRKGQHTYSSSGGTYVNSQIGTAVNPVIAMTALTHSNTWSLNCYEVRSDNGTTFSSGVGVINRHLPSHTTNIWDLLSNAENTSGYQLKLPTGTTLSLSGTYDYFVVIYSTEGVTTDANKEQHRLKTHIAKITSQIQFDDVNDGIEFTPKLGTEIVEGTKFAIYQGPAVADSNVVAVGYGLYGNNNSSDSAEMRYDEKAIVASPNFYFYGDRLNVKHQLNYSTKYTLLREQYAVTGGADTNGKVSVFVTCKNNGQRILDKSPYTYTADLIDNLFTADSIIDSSNLSSEYDKAGHRAHTNYTVAHVTWDSIARNMYRSSTNVLSTSLIGPSRYIDYNTSPTKTNVFPHILDLNIYKSISKAGSYGEVKFADPNKILHQKLKQYDDFKVKQILFEIDLDGSLQGELPGLGTKTSSTNLRITKLEDMEDLSYSASLPNYLTDNSNIEFIRIKQYYYKISNIGAQTFDVTNNYYYQDLTISHYRSINNIAWVAGGLQDDYVDTKYYRRVWSSINSNLLVNFNINDNFTNIEMVLKDGEYSGNRIIFSAVNKGRKLLTPSNIPTSIYQTTPSYKYLDYFKGTAIVDKEIYDGSIEYMEDKIEGGQLTYEIKGRDDIHKLLGPVINKNYLHASDYIYSTESPIQDITATIVKIRSDTSGSAIALYPGDTAGVATAGSSVSNTWTAGKKLYTSDGRYLATVKTSSSGTITFEEPCRCYYPITEFIWDATNDKIISGLGLVADTQATIKPNSIEYSSGKGIYFTAGTSSPVYGTASDMTYLSATSGEYSSGFDIRNIKALNSDTPFIFNIANETSSAITYPTDNYHTVSALTNYQVVGTIEKEDGSNTILELAPVSPFVLGRVDINSSDSRYTSSHGLYFLNNHSLVEGGLVNLIDSKTHTSANSKKAIGIHKHETSIFNAPMYKYIDLQKEGNLRFVRRAGPSEYDSESGERVAYNDNYNKVLPSLTTYACGYKFKGGIKSGTVVIHSTLAEYSDVLAHTLKTGNMKICPPENRGIVPLMGSNFADFDYYDTTKSGTLPWIYEQVYTFTLDPFLHTGTNPSGGVLPVYSPTAGSGNANNDDLGVRTMNFVIPQDTQGASGSQHQFNFTGNYNKAWGISNKGSNPWLSVINTKLNYECWDGKAIKYHIFGPCDTYNDSMNNRNHIGYSTHSFKFTDFGVVLMGDSMTVNKNTSHELYLGQSTSKTRTSESYQNLPIVDASITPSEMKRFSIGRLIEVGFDFHFNMIDMENSDAHKVNYGSGLKHLYSKFRMAEKTPITLTANVSLGDTSISVSNSAWFNNYVIGGTARTMKIDYLFNQKGEFIGIALGCTAGNITLVRYVDTVSGLTTANHNVEMRQSNQIYHSSNTGALATASSGEHLYAIRYEGDSSDINAPDDCYNDVKLTFEQGSWNQQFRPSVGNWVTDVKHMSRDNRFMWMAFNSDRLWYRNATLNKRQFFSEEGIKYNADGDDDGNIGDSTNFTWGSGDETSPKMYLPFCFNSHNLSTDLTTPGFARRDFSGLAYGRRLTPFHGSPSYTHSTYNDYMSDIGGTLINSTATCNDAAANSGDPSFTVSDGTQFAVGNGLYYLNGGNANDPIYIGMISAFNPSTHLLTISGNLKATVPNTQPIYLLRKSYKHYWHPSRVFQYMQSNNYNMVKYGLKPKVTAPGSGSGYKPGDLALYNFGTFVLLDKQTIGKSDKNSVSSGSSFSKGFGATGTNAGPRWSLNPQCTSDDMPEANAYQSDVFDHEWEDAAGNNDAAVEDSWVMPILSTNTEWCPGLYSVDNEKDNGTDGPQHVIIGGLWAFKPQLLMGTASADGSNQSYTGNNVRVGNAGENYYKESLSCVLVSTSATVNLVSGPYLTGTARLKIGMDVTGTNIPASTTITAINSTTQFTISNAASGSGTTTLTFDNDELSVRRMNSDVRKLTIEFGPDPANDYITYSFNPWLAFAPNLTGYYLVSNRGKEDGFDLPSVNVLDIGSSTGTMNNDKRRVPKYIHKIVKHEMHYDVEGVMVHNIWFDNATGAARAATGYDDTILGYRLMKFAEKCFHDFTHNSIDLYCMTNENTKEAKYDVLYSEIPKFNVSALQEANQAIDVKAEATKVLGFFPIGSTTTTTVRKVMVGQDVSNTSGLSLANEGVLSMYVLLDAEPESSNYTLVRDVSEIIGDDKKFSNNNTHEVLLTDGITTSKCSMHISHSLQPPNTDVNIFALTFSKMQQMLGLVSAGEIFNVTIPTPTNLKNIDQVKIGTTYNIGDEVEHILNDMMEDNNITYTAKNTTEKHFISPNIKGADLYNAVTYVSGYKNLEPLVIGKTIRFREKNDTDDIVGITIKEGESKVSISNRNETSFDHFNEINVYGSAVKGTKRDIKSIKDKGKKTLEETDLRLSTQREVDDRASLLLRLHSRNLNQIEISAATPELEYLDVGQIINVDYPSENIPVGKYQILEIVYNVGQPMKIILGFYNKKLDYRIAELVASNKRISADIRGSLFKESVDIYGLLDLVKIRELEIEIKETTTGTGPLWGFTSIFGFTNKFGFITPSSSEIVYQEDLT